MTHSQEGRSTLCLVFTHTRRIGYGRFAIDLARAVERRGVTVHDWTEGWQVPAADKVTNPGRAETVVWCQPPTHVKGWLKGQRPIVWTMWEATELPEAFRKNLHEFEMVLVPSPQNVELFSQWHDNVQLVPLGIDTDQWHYSPRPPRDVFFTFMTGGSGKRKGADVVWEAFQRAFPHPEKMDPIPRLVHKSPRGQELPVETVPGYLSDAEEIELYEQAHCWVQCSRGEGFGLQPLQAIAQGIPTILTAAHGHESFAHLGYGVRADLEPVESSRVSFSYGKAGNWWEPRVDDAADHMRYVYENYDQALDNAKLNAIRAAADFSWDTIAVDFLHKLGELRPYTGDGSWVEAKPKRFKVRVLREWKADVGGVAYWLKPGETYWEPSDIFRQLQEIGNLEPGCEGLDGTLDDSLPSSKHNYCPSCLQMLNTSPRRADVILLEDEVKRLQAELDMLRNVQEGLR